MNSGICGASGTMPDIESRAWAGHPRRPNGIYVPRFRNVKEKSTRGFIRGYRYRGGSSPNFNFGAPSFGESHKCAVRDTGQWSINLGLWGECLARKENYVEIDKSRVDAWGIPTLKVTMEWGDNEKALWKDGREQAGAKNIRLTGTYSIPGFCIHEIGTARMGMDRGKSVLNKYCQAHDEENHFVTDGAAWVRLWCRAVALIRR